MFVSTPAPLPRLLNAAEVEAATGIPKWRLYELVRTEAIPHVHLGRAVRFSPQALSDWLDAGGTASDVR